MKVAVLGAAGLVGNVLVRRLLKRPDTEVRACVRNPSTSWSLLGLGIPMVAADLRDGGSLRRAIEGCTHVVNCALGEDRELAECMRNLVDSCRQGGTHRLVHLSSVTVYGDPPPPDSTSESATPMPRKGTYGWHKLRQDEIALRAHESGLSTAVICLPHVTGPGSRFLLSVIRELRERRFALVDDGRHPVVMADVENVAVAIEAALAAPSVDGRRMFVNDGPAPAWSELIERLAPIAEIDHAEIPRLTAEQVRQHRGGPTLGTVTAARQLLAMPAVREVLAQTRLGADTWASRMAKGVVKRRMTSAKQATSSRPTACAFPPPGLWTQQLRMVDHSNARLQASVGFRPIHDFAASLQAFERWYAAMFLYGTPSWNMARRL